MLLFEARRPRQVSYLSFWLRGPRVFCYTRLLAMVWRLILIEKVPVSIRPCLVKRLRLSYVNIIDDGTQPFERGALNVDDEGNVTEKTYMVKDGILTSYLHDKISAKHYGVNPTGSGRRRVLGTS